MTEVRRDIDMKRTENRGQRTAPNGFGVQDGGQDGGQAVATYLVETRSITSTRTRTSTKKIAFAFLWAK
jgi:hypothetical protein